MGRLELPASSSQSWRAANCATPGYLVFHFPGSFRGFFVSVGIPVVTGKFPTKSTARQNRPFARVSRRSGLPQPTRWMPLSIIPKLARCQLRYTRLSRFSLPRLVPGFFRVCGHSCGQRQISTQIQPAPKPRVRPCVNTFRAFATNAMDAAVYHPKPPALPTALYPVNMLQLSTSYILSHQIPLCNAFFVAVCSGLC